MDNTNQLVLSSIDMMVQNNWLEKRGNEMDRHRKSCQELDNCVIFDWTI